MLIGSWYLSPHEALFDSVTVAYSSLRGWMWKQTPFLGEQKDEKIIVEYAKDDELYEFPVCSIESKISFH